MSFRAGGMGLRAGVLRLRTSCFKRLTMRFSGAVRALFKFVQLHLETRQGEVEFLVGGSWLLKP